MNYLEIIQSIYDLVWLQRILYDEQPRVHVSRGMLCENGYLIDALMPLK